MKKVTIIGCGWLGMPLGSALHTAGYQLSGSVRKRDALKGLSNSGIEGFLFDLTPEALVPEALAKETEILIITVPPTDRREPGRYAASIRKLIGQFSGLQQLIFTSSSGVYPQRSGEYNEEFSFLEVEKTTNVLYLAEQAVLRSSVPNKTVLRLSGLFGPNRHPVKQLAGKQNVSNPSGHVNLVHQKDVVRAIMLCIEKASEANGIFNLTYPDHPWRNVYYTKLYRQNNLEAIGFETSSSVDRLILGNKITKTLGFQYAHSIFDLEDVLANNL